MHSRNPRLDPPDPPNSTKGAGVGAPAVGESSGSHPPVDSDATLIEFPKPPSDPDATLVDADATLVDADATLVDAVPIDSQATQVDTTPPPRAAARAPVRLPVNAPVLQPGDVLGGRYEILQLLGEGGMGAVYKAMDRELDRPVALKLIRPELAANPSMLARFKQELLLSHKVTHKNVIRIYDLGDADGVKFITMEFVEGQDLRAIMHEQKKFSPEDAVEIIEQVCYALEAAHSVGIIHRDLKPQNIMRDKSGRILVMDFGLARTLGSDGMTQTGALVGTMEYMSPEQALAKELDQRSDLYTAGLILYELLTGVTPFKAESAVASLIKRTSERAKPVSDYDEKIPAQLSGIVSKCLERDLNLRYQTASELLKDLDTWYHKRAAATLNFQPAVEPWGRTINWPLVMGVATVLVLAIAGFLLRQKLFGPSTQTATAPAVSLAILPFRNASGDSSLNWLGTTVAQMLDTDMGESTYLRTVASDRVDQILHDLRVAPDATLDPDTLRRVAEFTSADRLLWGQYLKLGDQIRIDATLEDLKQQRNFALKAEAANEKDLPRALEQLAQSVEKNLALPPETLKEIQAKALKPSTQSVQALRYYSEGLQLARQGKNLEAAKQFEAAIKEDPNFALAYSKLGLTYAALGYGDKAQEFSRKAVDLSDKVSPQEKYVIQAEEVRVTRDYGKAIEAYEQLAKILPEDSDVQYALARLYEDSGSLDKARVQYEKLLARDPKNVDTLLHMGVLENYRNNPQGGLDYLSRGLPIAVQMGNEEEKAAIQQAIGNSYQDMNKLDDALRNYQDALDARRRLGDKGGIAEALGWMAEVQQTMGRSEQALKSLQESIGLRREIGDKSGLGKGLLDLGGFYENIGRYDEALNSAKEALLAFRSVGDRQSEAICLNNIGWYYLLKGDYEDALTYSQQALQIGQSAAGAPGELANTLYNIGEIYVRMGEYSQGTDYYLKALDLWRKADDKSGVAYASYGLGRVFQFQGRYGAALNSENDALNNWRATNDRGYWLPQIQASYGNTLTLLGRWDEAQKNLDQALELARELKNNSVIAQILSFQGDRFFYRGESGAARSLFEQALQAAERTSDREQVLMAKFNLAKLAVKEGHAREQLGGLEALTEQAEKAGLQYLAVESSITLAEALIESKDYSRALKLLDHSLRQSDKLGLEASLAKGQYLLADVLRLSGKETEATHHYAEAHRILDAIAKEAGTGEVLKRRDFAVIYEESARRQGPTT
ncbi:MAG TPA: tetratricopeptide repeat protein [Candidatus Bathyarchaeia archaeon]|nr:tetratricopeptide repeat protein [Candidatus Bathyarchaeia archaeon]